MAFVGSDSNQVWQQVKASLSLGTGTNPVARDAFDALRRYLASQGGNPQLQILPFSEADCDAANGTPILAGACKIYGVYVKKVSAATDNYFKIYDNATVDTTAGDQIIAIPLLATVEEAFEIHPAGLAMAAGVTVTQHTTSIGVTDGSDGGNGFVIIGAA